MSEVQSRCICAPPIPFFSPVPQWEYSQSECVDFSWQAVCAPVGVVNQKSDIDLCASVSGVHQCSNFHPPPYAHHRRKKRQFGPFYILPSCQVSREIWKKNTTALNRDEKRKRRKKNVITYVAGLFQKNILKTHCIPDKNRLIHPKDKVPKQKLSGVVYVIQCSKEGMDP